MNEEGREQAATMLEGLAARIRSGEFESADMQGHAFSREHTPPGATAIHHELTGSLVYVLCLQKARADA